jgi:hypothetical protein
MRRFVSLPGFYWQGQALLVLKKRTRANHFPIPEVRFAGMSRPGTDHMEQRPKAKPARRDRRAGFRLYRAERGA